MRIIGVDPKALNQALIIGLAVGAMLLGLLDKPTEMGLLILACGVSLAFLNIDKIQRFKGAGFEAEMKRAVEEAYATTENLKEVVRPLVLTSIERMTYAGRWGGGESQENKERLKESLESLSKSLGVYDDEIEAAFNKFYIYHGVDHLRFIGTAMNHIHHIQNKEVTERINSLCDWKGTELPPVEEVQSAISSLGEDQIALLRPYVEDYSYYRENKQLRRPEALRLD